MVTYHIEPCPQCKGVGIKYIRNASVKIDEITCGLCQVAGSFIVKQERIKATKHIAARGVIRGEENEKCYRH